MKSTAELNREYESRARSLGLTVECAADGAFNSEIAIIGEAPGPREVALKIPLVGGSGQLVWQTLKRHNLTRRDVYITNVIKKQLASTEDQEKVKIPRAEMDHWEALLKWELAHLPNCKYVLLLGNMALQALLGKTGIIKWRGSVMPFKLVSNNDTQPRDYMAVCTYNPAYVLREPKNEIAFHMDLAKLPKVVSGQWTPYIINPTILLTHSDVVKTLGELDGQPYNQPISFDIETGGGETSVIGFAADAHNGFCIPFRSDDGTSIMSLQEEMETRRLLQRMFAADGSERGARPKHKWVAQNANFDMYWLWYKDKIRVNACWFDTMLAHHCLYPTLPHNLGYLTTQYTTHPYYKDERLEWKDKGDITGYWEYNIKDCCLTWEIARKLKKELEEQDLDKFFFEHVMRLQPHLVRMTVGGVKIDVPRKADIASRLTEEVSVLLHNFHVQVGEATGDSAFRPNPLSRPQVSELLFRRLRLVGKGTSTDAANRKRMLDHPKTSEGARTVLRTLDEYKEKQKFLSTYAESAIDDDGRIRCEWKQTGVVKAPGRLSSASVIWGTGMNLQNQPPASKEMFITDPDYVFVYYDLTQAEAQYVAWDAGIEEWKRQYTKSRLEGGGYDAHRALASILFKVPYDQVPTADHDADGKPTIRYKAKRARHGLNYRMAPDTFAAAAGLSISDAVDLYTLYHRETPELRRWWAALEQEVRTTKQLFNAYGRRLYFLERLNTPEAMESIVAFKPQSSIGDKVSRSIYMCHEDEAWPDRHGRIAMNVHDALIGLVHKDHAKNALRIMKRHAEEPMMVRGEPLIIAAEMGMSVPDEHGVHRWSTIKKIKGGLEAL